MGKEALRLHYHKSDRWKGIGYITPWLVGFLGLQLYPFIMSLYYSFTDYDMLGKPSWVGLKNYIDIFTADIDFLPSVKATLLYVITVVPFKLIFALIVAMILNNKL